MLSRQSHPWTVPAYAANALSTSDRGPNAESVWEMVHVMALRAIMLWRQLLTAQVGGVDSPKMKAGMPTVPPAGACAHERGLSDLGPCTQPKAQTDRLRELARVWVCTRACTWVVAAAHRESWSRGCAEEKC